MAEVIFTKVRKTYRDGVTTIDNLNLQVHDKEFMVLVGPSGCGKSTTLRMLAGLEEISAGTITIDGVAVQDLPPKDRDIAMVFQNYALYPHMTVYDNMAYGLKMRKYPKAEIAERVKEAAEILGLTQYLDRKPKALSGGQRQRVAVGRAIVRKPKVFLFDEPLSNLDAKMRVQMRAEIIKLYQKLNTTIVYVTHDQIEAMTMGTRICVMKDGIIQQLDTPQNIFRHPANLFVAGFIGTPPMNFIKGTLKSEGKALRFTSEQLTIQLNQTQAEALSAYDKKPIILGIRPSDIHEYRDSDASQSFELPIELIESLGEEQSLYLTSENPLIVKLPTGMSYTIGATFKGSINLSRTHFFDPETTLSLI